MNVKVNLIDTQYRVARDTPSDINEHVTRLYELALECDSVVEAGVRYVVSSWAFLLGCACRGGRVDSYCWNHIKEIEDAQRICETAQVSWNFHAGDWLKAEIPETDLLFIDTNHYYSQLCEELRMHGGKARKYIVLHDTTSFGDVGQDGKAPGLWQAVQELCRCGTWKVLERKTNNNGLTVMGR